MPLSYLLEVSKRLTLAPLMLAFFVGCSTFESHAGSCEQCRSGCGAITGSEAKELVGGGALLVDVRTRREFDDGHIDGAVNIPLAELEARLAELDAQRELVLYCRSGNRSGQARKLLCTRGYTAHDLGPKTAWR